MIRYLIGLSFSLALMTACNQANRENEPTDSPRVSGENVHQAPTEVELEPNSPNSYEDPDENPVPILAPVLPPLGVPSLGAHLYPGSLQPILFGGGGRREQRIICGDGIIRGTESCDDNNTQSGDGCSFTCTIESGFECAGQPSVCQGCGNGIKEGIEQCDDGNATSADGCTNCTYDALRAFLTEASYLGDLVSAANSLTPPVSLTQSYNCSADLYVGGTFASAPTTSGVAAANCLCREQAATQGNDLRCADGTFSCWNAWLADSSGTSAPAARFNISLSNSTDPIYQVDANGAPDASAPIAVGGWMDLVACGINNPGDNESGPPATCLDDPLLISSICAPALTWAHQDAKRGPAGSGFNDVWTHVTQTGLATAGNSHCTNWTIGTVFDGGDRGDSQDRRGLSIDTCWVPVSVGWTEHGGERCSNDGRIYCFEDR